MVDREVDGQHVFSLHVFFYVFDCRRSRGRDRRRAGRSGLSRRGSRFVLSRFGCRGRRGSRFVLSRLGCRGRRSGLSPVLDRLSREPETWPKLRERESDPAGGLGSFLVVFAPLLAVLGLVLAALGSILAGLGPVLTALASLLGRSWPLLAGLGPVLAALGPVLAALGPLLGRSWVGLGRSWVHCWRSRAVLARKMAQTRAGAGSARGRA